MSDQKRLVFVTGCPRSGTTALVRLLNAHPDVAIGMERYSRLLENERRLDVALFDADRFGTFVDGDGNKVDFDHRINVSAREKIAQAKVVGDKTPNPTHVFEAAELHDDVAVIVILREPKGVARSFDVRARRAQADPEAAKYWPAYRNYRRAVVEFNKGMHSILAFFDKRDDDPDLASRVKTKVVIYEDLFKDRAKVADLFAFLGLDLADAPAVEDLLAEAKMLKRSKWTPIIDFHVARKANHDDYRRAVALSRAVV